VVVKFKRVKPFIVFGTCLWVVSMGMLIHYRGGEGSHSGIVGAMVVLGIGTGFFTYPTQVSLQSCVNHQHMATVTSMYLAFYWIGSSVGSAISGAVWTQTLPKYLSNQLDDQSLVKSAYGDPMAFIVDYPWGSPERDAVVVAYRQTQRILLITATCMCVLLVTSALFLRDRRLDNVQSLKHAEETDIVEQQIEKKPWYKRIFQVETA
jgi:SIT family siderophore-iron:H+ symporter-like MFS transporter